MTYNRLDMSIKIDKNNKVMELTNYPCRFKITN
nr:MAG TPA: hypothetical protein [Caudoviricetes sp.]